MTILSMRPGSLNSFAIKLRPTDTVQSLQSRAARKLAIPGDGADIRLQYLWCEVWYTLDDDDDFLIFLERTHSQPEVTLLLSSPSIPTTNPSIAGLSSLPSSSLGSHRGAVADNASIYSSSGGNSGMFGRSRPRDLRKETSMHLVDSSLLSADSPHRAGAGGGGASIRSGRSTIVSARKKGGANVGGGPGGGGGGGGGGGDAETIKSRKSAMAPISYGVPEHKIKFEEFHNQLGVRTFIGSIGPIQNVRMMMKPGHRACYMSRAFAQEHDFIPKDAAPGFYGFSGITNLGTWPIRVGRKTVEQQVMLVEKSYFPIILGRSFMERRGVRTDPVDQTNVVFMDTMETVQTDLVIVKDAEGKVIPIS